MPDLSLLRALPHLRSLLGLASVAFFALACLEGTFGRLLRHRWGYGPREFGLLFGYESLLSVLVQALVLSWLVSRVRAPRLLAAAYLLQAGALALTPFASGLSWLFVLSTVYAFGLGVASPSLNALCSAVTPRERQGEMFGHLQSARSIGFLIGPTLGSVLFDWRPDAPYLLAGAALVIAGGIWLHRSRQQEQGQGALLPHRHFYDNHHRKR